MEPFAIQSGVNQTVRPVLALDSSLTAVLKEGRTVAGEVLQTMDGHSLLIGVGRHRVPAQSHVEMQAGDRFLARVEETPEGTVLRVLGGRPGAESPLVVALRSVVGKDMPVGQLLEELSGALQKAIHALGDDDGALLKLIRSIGEHVYIPGTSGEELQRLLARSGLDYEALLLAVADAQRSSSSLEAVGTELLEKLLANLKGQLGQAGFGLSGAQEKELTQLLRQILGQLANTGMGSRGELHQEVTRELLQQGLRALSAKFEGEGRDALLAALPKALVAILGGAGQPTPIAEKLLLILAAQRDTALLAQNLKAELLGALDRLPEGAERTAVSKALAGLESEQLLNLARREFHEGWHLSLPVPDGERWATAHLFYFDPDPDPSSPQSGGDDMQRLTLAVDFSRIGPLRAEIGVREGLVAVRMTVSSPVVAEHLRAQLGELEEGLSFGGRVARATVVLGTREEAGVDPLSQDIRWLREHHLMDLSG